MSEPFIGEIRLFGFVFAPRGYAFCSGQLLPIAQNTALFSILGTTYGGDGRTTFALPNLQGRLPMGTGFGPGLTPRTLGQRAGVDSVTLSIAQIPSHRHELNSGPAAGLPLTSPSNNSLSVSTVSPYQTTINPQDLLANVSVPSTGGAQAHTNLQPLLSINFCIALSGLFPPRS